MSAGLAALRAIFLPVQPQFNDNQIRFILQSLLSFRQVKASSTSILPHLYPTPDGGLLHILLIFLIILCAFATWRED